MLTFFQFRLQHHVTELPSIMRGTLCKEKQGKRIIKCFSFILLAFKCKFVFSITLASCIVQSGLKSEKSAIWGRWSCTVCHCAPKVNINIFLKHFFEQSKPKAAQRGLQSEERISNNVDFNDHDLWVWKNMSHFHSTLMIGEWSQKIVDHDQIIPSLPRPT